MHWLLWRQSSLEVCTKHLMLVAKLGESVTLTIKLANWNELLSRYVRHRYCCSVPEHSPDSHIGALLLRNINNSYEAKGLRVLPIKLLDWANGQQTRSNKSVVIISKFASVLWVVIPIWINFVCCPFLYWTISLCWRIFKCLKYWGCI